MNQQLHPAGQELWRSRGIPFFINSETSTLLMTILDLTVLRLSVLHGPPNALYLVVYSAPWWSCYYSGSNIKPTDCNQ